VAMKITGHRTEAIYRRYAIVATSDLREAGAKLAALGDNYGPPTPGFSVLEPGWTIDHYRAPSVTKSALSRPVFTSTAATDSP
jgi:hypothetical protein